MLIHQSTRFIFFFSKLILKIAYSTEPIATFLTKCSNVENAAMKKASRIQWKNFPQIVRKLVSEYHMMHIRKEPAQQTVYNPTIRTVLSLALLSMPNQTLKQPIGNQTKLRMQSRRFSIL